MVWLISNTVQSVLPFSNGEPIEVGESRIDTRYETRVKVTWDGEYGRQRSIEAFGDVDGPLMLFAPCLIGQVARLGKDLFRLSSGCWGQLEWINIEQARMEKVFGIVAVKQAEAFGPCGCLGAPRKIVNQLTLV